MKGQVTPVPDRLRFTHDRGSSAALELMHFARTLLRQPGSERSWLLFLAYQLNFGPLEASRSS